MSSPQTQSSSRRSGRRGGKRSGSYRPGGRRDRQATTSRSAQPARKPSLMERIVAFFTGGKPAASTDTRGNKPKAQAASPASRKPERRAPERIEVTSPRLYVGNLSYDATESDLFELFNGVGSVQNAEIVTHKQSQRSKGFAFIVMQSVDEAKRAVDVLHDQDFMGRKLVVSGAKTEGS